MATRVNNVVERFTLVGDDKSFGKTFKGAAKDTDHLDHNMSKLGKAFQAFGVSGIGRGFGDLKQALGGFARGNLSYGVSSLSRAFTGLNAAGRGAYAAIGMASAGVAGLIAIGIKATKTYMALGRTLQQFSRVGGLTPSTSLDLYGQLKMTGADPAAASKMLGMFGKNIEMARQGTGKQALAMKMLGVELKNANGGWKTESELLPEVRNALSETTDAAARNFTAQSLFGRGWQTLSKWITASASDIKRYNKVVKESGFTWAGKDSAGMKKLLETQRTISLQWELLLAGIGKALSPYMAKIMKVASVIGPAFLNGFKAGAKAIAMIFAPLGAVIKALDKLWPSLDVVKKIASAFGFLLPIIIAVGGALTTFVLAVKGLQALSGAKAAAAAWYAEKVAIDANTASAVANARAKATGVLPPNIYGRGGAGAMGTALPGYADKAAIAQQARIAERGAVQAAKLEKMAAAASAAGIAPALAPAIRATEGLGVAASATSGRFAALGASIKASVVAMGPWIIAAAAVGAAYLGIKWAYDQWQGAEKDLATAQQGTADTITKNLKRVGDEYGVLSGKYQKFAAQVSAGNKQMLVDAAQQTPLAQWNPAAAAASAASRVVGYLTGNDAGKAAAALKPYQDALDVLNKGALTDAGKQQILGDIGELKKLGTVAAPAVAELTQRLLNIDPSALDTAAEKAAKLKAALAATQKAAADFWLGMATGNKEGTYGTGPGQIDQFGTVTGGAQGTATKAWLDGLKATNEATVTAAQQAALDGADLAAKLAAIPKNVLEVLNGRDWGAIGAAAKNAMLAFNSGFSDMTDALITLWAGRMGNLMGIVEALGGILKSFADAPKKIIKPLQQNWTAMGVAMFNAMTQVNAAFAKVSDEGLVADAARMGSIGSAAGGIGSFISALADMPKKAVKVIPQAWHGLAVTLSAALSAVLSVFTDKGLAKQAERAGSVGSAAGGLGSFISALADMPKKAVKVVPEAWKKLATVLNGALTAALSVFAATSTKGLAGNAERMGSIGSAAGGIGSFISALAGLPDKAVKIIPQKWKALAQVVKAAVDQVLAVFQKVSTKQLAGQSDRAGSVAGMAGSLGSIISAFVDAPDAAVSVIPQKWHSLAVVIKKAVDEVLTVYKDVSDKMLGKKGDRMGLIGALVGPLGDILSYFENAPKTVITTMRQNWSAFGTAMIEGVEGVLKQFAIWDDKMLKSKSEKMGFIGTMVSVIGSIADLANSLPDMAANLQKFATMTYGNLWQGIGSALTKMINGIVGALHIIPDATKLQTALDAVTLLRDIFASMVEVQANAINSMNTGAPVAAFAGATGTQAVAPVAPAMASQSCGSVQVNVSWQTLTGEPSEREKRQLVRRLKPEFARLAKDRKRTGF